MATASQPPPPLVFTGMTAVGPVGAPQSARSSNSGGASRPSANVSAQPSPKGGRSAMHTNVTDFTSDVGRKRFGFSHEELDDCGAYYEGQFKLYQRCGSGTLHSPDTASKYVGQFQRDTFHGWGEMVWSDGSRYGGCTNNRPHSSGPRTRYSVLDRPQSGDKAGAKSRRPGGECAHSDRRGRPNEGEWYKGQKHGVGEYISADGLRYVGQWSEGRRHGQGTQYYANHDCYEGWWYHGLCSGLGTYRFADGSRYEGAWANGRYDGAGVLYGADGSRERQWYSQGLLMKREVLPASSATTAKGSRKTGVRGKPTQTQTREEVQKPTSLAAPLKSQYLIQRETAGMDLSAPPLRRSNLMAKPVDRGNTDGCGDTVGGPNETNIVGAIGDAQADR